MQSSQRLITELPLHELWNDDGVVQSRKVRDLSIEDLRELVSRGAVRFVIADVDAKPKWIAESACFDFWKGGVQKHIADSARRVHLEDFPNGYCYFAEEWEGAESPIVVLRRYH
jgi:hypothetical protein